MNRVMLLGNLGADPEIRTGQDGQKIAILSLATKERWTNKNGHKLEKTDWHRVVVFKSILVSYINDNVHKGNRVFIEGSINSRRYQGHKDQKIIEIVLNERCGELYNLSHLASNANELHHDERH